MRAHQRKKKLKAQHRQKLLQSRVVTPIDIEKYSDPLQTKSRSLASNVLFGAALILGTTSVHAGTIGLFATVGETFRTPSKQQPKSEPISVVVTEVPPPEPEPPKVEKAQEPTQQPAAAAPPEPKPKPKPKKRKRKPKRRPPPPPPDPVNQPEKPQKKPRKIRRVVGLSLGSTVKGGSGPSFAVGNTRMGVTKTEAQEAETIKKLPKTKEKIPKANRSATRLPIGLGGPALTKPIQVRPVLEPQYPSEFRAQGLTVTIVISTTINSAGKATELKVIRGSKYPAFVEAALKTARRQRWKPAKRANKPIAYTITQTYTFRVKD